MDNLKGFHLAWPILMVILAFPLRRPELKGMIEHPNDPVFASKQQAISKNLSVRNGFGSADQDGLRNLELVNDRRLLNKPYLFGAHQFLLRSSAVSIHDPNNLISIGVIVFVSVLMAFLLLSLFQR